MDDAWGALALAILAPRQLLVEEAEKAFRLGRIDRRDMNVIIPEALKMRDMGLGWNEISDIYGMEKGYILPQATRWKAKHRQGVS